MKDTTEIIKDQKTKKRNYEKPLLIDLGDLRSLTLGITPGIADASGGGFPENTQVPIIH